MDTIHMDITLSVSRLKNTITIIQDNELEVNTETFLFFITTKSRKYYIIRYMYKPEEKKYCNKTKCKLKLNNSSIVLSILKTNNEDDVLNILYKVCSEDYQLDGMYDRTKDGYITLSRYIDRHRTLSTSVYNGKNYNIINAFLQSIFSFYDKECDVYSNNKFNCHSFDSPYLMKSSNELITYLHKIHWMHEYAYYFNDMISRLDLDPDLESVEF